MVTFEALNALYGDCLLLRYPGPDNKERMWIVDGGPRSETVDGQPLSVWMDVLLPRLKEINSTIPLPVALGMVSHIDDDHINGIQNLTSTLVAATPRDPSVVKFARFWFNSFDDLVGPKPAGLSGEVASASMATLAEEAVFGIDDYRAQLIMQSVPQGNRLASDLRSLRLSGNKPVNGLVVAREGQQKFNIEGASVTIVGPLQKRINKLRVAWAAALSKATKAARQAALQELFLPARSLDKSVPNLSSIVVLVEVGGRKLLLTGDAHGDDVVTGWKELGLGAGPVNIDILKLPHHGSIRNVTKKLIEFFVADHYVFSANGKYDNPDAPSIEAIVKMHAGRPIKLHFTNADVMWSEEYKLEKDNKSVRNLDEMLTALRAAYPGPWSARTRDPQDKSIIIELS
jgi:hypothetical protein